MSVIELTKDGLGARAVARSDAFGVPPYSEDARNLTRRFLTPAHAAALESLTQWMTAAGMTVHLDPVGNVVGRYEGATPGAPALMIGSHVDTVRDAGCYDGTLGVMLGLSCVEALAAQGRRLPFAIEVVAFGDEEGSRFSTGMICSRAVSGQIIDGAEYAALKDSDGVSLADAMKAFGLDAAKIPLAARRPEELVAYLEAHIEQGPVLEAEEQALGVVSGISAQLRLHAVFTGKAGHAGTNPMGLRHDALAAAAEAILAVEQIAETWATKGVVGTVGFIDAKPGAPNVIAGKVEITLDVRAIDRAIRDAAAKEMETRIAAIASRRCIGFVLRQTLDLQPHPSDPALTAMLEAVLSDMGLRPLRLASGAGHDAGALAAITPMAMLFIRCAGGISHNPAEAVDPADVDLAAETMLRFIDRLEASYKK
ncbi:allantoate amidohydrolase [Parvibaculum sedimenti]|uniref:Allantoate amidohydrolase n=1 Tax=Parvibaculum sedimenti TaxID=2608632 RepID=A0A6N6VR74_9HYPH|nr:allantoate amidohydrolase [Parvibaculum sedimenti]KAB7741746.1 allantoate amidohydrolase [Parvibaculum sedimenti]